MDIIAAWKAARENQSIKCGPHIIKKTKNVSDLTEFLWREITGDYNSFTKTGRITDDYILADDWEVIKEKKKIEFKAHRGYSNCSHLLYEDETGNNIANKLPPDMSFKITIEWEE